MKVPVDQWIPVVSSAISSVKIISLAADSTDELFGVLRVEFCNGSIYDYAYVAFSRILALLRAESKGSYLANEIKPYSDYRKVTEGWVEPS